MSGLRYGSDKEVAAVTFNMKEQRCLEKSLQTLSLEKTYSLKLLDLDHRIIKVNYRRLKDKVSRIKSNLTAEEIAKLRRLEAEGKLRPTYNSVNISGALKIAAAARRLKFPNEGRERAKSAHPRLNGHQQEKLLATRIGTANKPEFRRSNSVTGIFIDAPSVDACRRRGSVDLEIPVDNKFRPFSAFAPAGVHYEENYHQKCPDKRPATSVGINMEKGKNGLSRPVTGVSQSTHTHSPFSSHSVTEKDARSPSLFGAASKHSREAKSSYFSDDSIDSNLGEDLFEERRQEMLEEEFAKSAELEERKNEFLRQVEGYLKVNLPLESRASDNNAVLPRSDKPMPESCPGSRAGSAGMTKRLSRRRQLRVDFDHTPTHLPEEAYKRRLFSLWSDMNKCRYLRVPEEIIDLSGIVTLAQDQIRLFDVLRQTDQQSFAASVQL